MILAMDTATNSCSLAIIQDGALVANSHVEMSRGQAEHIFPALETMLKSAGITMKEITHIVVTKGPGSFTGVRLAVAAARAFAVSLKVPIAAITTLEALTLTAVISGQLTIGDNVLATEDARRGEVYTQGFKVSDSQYPLLETSPPEALLAGELPDHLSKEKWIILGSGTGLLTIKGKSLKALDATIKSKAAIWGRAVAPILISRSQPHIKPLYIRPPDAKPQKKLWLDCQD